MNINEILSTIQAGEVPQVGTQDGRPSLLLMQASRQMVLDGLVTILEEKGIAYERGEDVLVAETPQEVAVFVTPAHWLAGYTLKHFYVANHLSSDEEWWELVPK